MQVLNHMIVKYFSKREYAEDFVNGNLYMNSLHYFWDEYPVEQAMMIKKEYLKKHPEYDADSVLVKIGKRLDPYTADIFEGACSTINPKNFGMPQDFADATMCDSIFRIYGYRYANVLCLSKIDFQIQKTLNNKVGLYYEVSEQMKSFGKYVVVVDDELEFYNRVSRAAEKNHYKFLYGDVEYRNFPPEEMNLAKGNSVVLKSDMLFDYDIICSRKHLSSVRDVFTKSLRYSYQKERRLVSCRGKKSTEAYSLQVGTLRDIVHMVNVDDLARTIQFCYASCLSKPSMEGYKGNVKSRGQLKDMFLKLGNNKVEMFQIVG